MERVVRCCWVGCRGLEVLAGGMMCTIVAFFEKLESVSGEDALVHLFARAVMDGS